MKIFEKTFPKMPGVCLSLFLILMSANISAQIVTNGGFESSDTGAVEGVQIEGWQIITGSGVDPLPVYEIVSDTVQQGERALKVTLQATGANQWDIQVVADSLPVEPGVVYEYSIWAKAEKSGAQVNFTVGNYSYSEYSIIRPANLTTRWKEYTMRFSVTDNQSFIRAP